MNNQNQHVTTAPVIILTGSKTADRLAVAAFVCGIVGILSLVCGFVPGFLGYALYLDAKRRGGTHRLMGSAKVLCILSMLIPALLTGLSVACFGSMLSMYLS